MGAGRKRTIESIEHVQLAAPLMSELGPSDRTHARLAYQQSIGLVSRLEALSPEGKQKLGLTEEHTGGVKAVERLLRAEMEKRRA